MDEAGETDPSRDHGFGFWEFMFGLLKVVGIIIGILVLLGVVICVLEFFNIPATDWVVNLLFG